MLNSLLKSSHICNDKKIMEHCKQLTPYEDIKAVVWTKENKKYHEKVCWNHHPSDSNYPMLILAHLLCRHNVNRLNGENRYVEIIVNKLRLYSDGKKKERNNNSQAIRILNRYVRQR